MDVGKLFSAFVLLQLFLLSDESLQTVSYDPRALNVVNEIETIENTTTRRNTTAAIPI